jgi:alpha-1,2-mannosyltransferase
MTLRVLIRRYWALPLLAIGALFYFRRFAKDPVGMIQFPAGAKCLLENLPLQQCDQSFTYPPFFALVMTPFVSLTMPVRNIVWYIVTLAAITGSFAACDFLARRAVGGEWKESELAWLRGATFLFSLKFILSVLENQSYDALVLLFVVAGIVLLVERRNLFAGISLAVAAALKMTPLVFLPYLVFKRRYAAAVVMTAVFVVLSLLPDLVFSPPGSVAHFRMWVDQVAGAALLERINGPQQAVTTLHVFWHGSNPNNYSLRALAGWFIDDYTDNGKFRILLYAIYTAYLAVIAAVMWRRRGDDGSMPSDGALLVISMLMLSPMTSRSHCVVLMLPYAILAAVWIKEPASRLIGGALLLASFALATLSSNDLVGRRISEWSTEHRLPTFGILILVAYLGWAAYHRARRETRTVPV